MPQSAFRANSVAPSNRCRRSWSNSSQICSSGATAESIPAKAYTVEPTGDVTFVQAFLSGAIVNISVPPNVDVAPDEPIWLEFDQERMHLFDGATEMAVRAD